MSDLLFHISQFVTPSNQALLDMSLNLIQSTQTITTQPVNLRQNLLNSTLISIVCKSV